MAGEEARSGRKGAGAGGVGAGAAKGAGRDAGRGGPRNAEGSTDERAKHHPARGERRTGDTTVMKVDSRYSPHGDEGQKYLASGKSVAMRMWEEVQPGEAKDEVARDYETVGFVLRGRAELRTEGQVVILSAGDSWSVPKGARHTYLVLEPFTAVEATHPPAQAHGRDELRGATG